MKKLALIAIAATAALGFAEVAMASTTGTGIQAVFQQFLDYRRRTLNHLTGGNLVRQSRTQQVNAAHLGRYFRLVTQGVAASVAAGIFSTCPILTVSLRKLLALRKATRLVR